MCVFFLCTVDFTLPSSFLVNLVQALVSVRLLSVHGGLHTSIFLSGELSSGNWSVCVFSSVHGGLHTSIFLSGET